MDASHIVNSLTVTLAVVFGQAQAAPVELVTNGSFESIDGHTTLANDSWKIFNNITGWTGIGHGIEVRNNNYGPAFDGKYYVELDTTANSAMQQSIATSAGQDYQLSFAFQNRNYWRNVPLSSQGIEVFWNGVSQGVFNDSTNWKVVTLDVKGIAGASFLKFAAVGSSDSLGTSLDRVSLVAAPVPEPETYAMLLGGLVLLGGLALRRKQASM